MLIPVDTRIDLNICRSVIPTLYSAATFIFMVHTIAWLNVVLGMFLMTPRMISYYTWVSMTCISLSSNLV